MITIIGGSNIDLYGHHSQSATTSYHDSIPGEIKYHAGGVGRNIAENLGRLGCRPCLITVLGDDSHADLIMATLSDADVDTTQIIRRKHARSDGYMAMFHKNGEMITAVNDMSLIESLDTDAVKRHITGMIAGDFVIMDGNVDGDIIQAVCTDDAPYRIGFDGVSSHKAVKIKPYLARLSLLKCNRQEAAALTGLPVEALDFDHARALREAGVETVVISDGSDGFMIGHGEGYERFAAEPSHHIINVSGAGDALMAGVFYGLSEGMDIRSTGELAAQLAQLTLSCDGPVHQDIATLIKRDTP